MMMWSQQLPCRASAGSAGSQFLSFFPHEGPGLVGLDLPGLDAPDHAVVKLLGVLAEAGREAQDGVEADAAQPGGGAAAGALGEVPGEAAGAAPPGPKPNRA